MCDVCVMNAVKDKMLSRRNFFKAGAAGAVAAATTESSCLTMESTALI